MQESSDSMLYKIKREENVTEKVNSDIPNNLLVRSTMSTGQAWCLRALIIVDGRSSKRGKGFALSEDYRRKIARRRQVVNTRIGRTESSSKVMLGWLTGWLAGWLVG